MKDVYETLKVLEVAEEPVDTAEAHRRFVAGTAGRVSRQKAFSLTWSRNWAVAAAIVVLVTALSPVRSLGQRFLEMLRVQKLAVVPVNDLPLLNGGVNTPGKMLTQLISDSFVMTIKPGPELGIGNLSAARQYVGFPVEELSGLGAASDVKVEDQGAFHVTLSVDKMRAVLEEAGRNDIQIPDSVNGSTVAVHVSKGVQAEYGACETGDLGCIHFLQVPVPDVSVPPGLDMAGLAQAGLQLAGLSATEAQRVAKTIDWTSTLVVPVPQSQATYQTVPVDGTEGILVQWMPKRAGTSASYQVIWVKDGVIRMLHGRGNNSRALAAAAQPL